MHTFPTVAPRTDEVLKVMVLVMASELNVTKDIFQSALIPLDVTDLGKIGSKGQGHD